MDGLGELPLFPKGTSWEAAWGRLEEFALNDGLPMVPPTGALLEFLRCNSKSDEWSPRAWAALSLFALAAALRA